MQQLLSGDLFANRFEIDREAGSGGMGTVYRARDRLSGSIVALKLLHDPLGDSSLVERFTREAELLAELPHPGIVSYIAHGQTPSGQLFLAMEWLAGEDLAHRLARGPLKLQDTLLLLGHTATALSAAHQRGIVHRDVKPSNLYLPDGDIRRVKLLDFGIARRLVASRAMTRTGALIGTPAYMAPEQVRGARGITPAADIFSLGCVLYECLTGEPPFVGEHIAAVLTRILFDEPAPLALHRPGMPEAVQDLLVRMLQKEPTQRLADAGVLSQALASLGEMAELPILATLAAPAVSRISSSFAESEQVLFSLVVAAARQQAQAQLADATLQFVDAALDAERRAALLAAVRAMGVQANFLLGDVLLVTVPAIGSATDQAALAARAALQVKRQWPSAEVAVATERGVAQGVTRIGEVADRAARLLQNATPAQPPANQSSVSGVWLDELSTRLLGPRFAILPTPRGGLLIGEETDMDESRPLLGKSTPCVGREAELGTLESHLTGCIEESQARAVLITAAPGIGKSRLRHEFLRRVQQRAEPVTVLFGSGELMSAGAAYGILGKAMRKLCGIFGSESLASQREKVVVRLQCVALAERERVELFIGEMLALPGPTPVSAMLLAARADPRLMRDHIRQAFVDWLTSETTAAPVLLILDDLQWGDALSVELVGEALRELAAAPLYVVALARPEVHGVFPKLWKQHKLQEIQLNGLSKKACERLIHQVLGKQLAPAAVAHLVEQAAGNVLFLEELIRAAAEGKIDGQPDTVLAMLQVRLGRFDAGPRRVVLAASVFGQKFWHGGVAALLGVAKESAELLRWLETLGEAEVIKPNADSNLPGQRQYSFRHALVRDAAYELLTDTDRATGHGLAGAFLEAAGEHDLAVLAAHLERGKNPARAAMLYTRAAVQLYERQDQQGAARCAERALACGAKGPDHTVLLALQAIVAFWQEDLQTCVSRIQEVLSRLDAGSLWWCRALGAGVMAAGQSGAQAALSQFSQALLSAGPQAEAQAAYVEAMGFLANIYCIVGQPELVDRVHGQLVQLGFDDAKNDPSSRGFRNLSLAFDGFLIGDDPWLPVTWARRSLAAFQEVGDLRNQIGPQTFLGMALAGLGDLEGAEQQLRECLRNAEHFGQAFLLDYTRLHLAFFLSNSSRHAREASALAREQLVAGGANSLHLSMAHGVLARAAAVSEAWTEAMAEASQAGETLRYFPPYWFFVAPTQIYALLKLNGAPAALQLAEEAIAQLQQTRSGGINEIAVRLAYVEALTASGATGRAKAALCTAQTVLEQRASKIPEPGGREKYLSQVRENAQVLKIVRDNDALAQGR